MQLDHPSDGLAAIRTHIGAIFVSLELSRSNWLVTSLSPGHGEKMSRHGVTAGDTAELMKLFAELRRKAEVRTGQSYPIITIQEWLEPASKLAFPPRHRVYHGQPSQKPTTYESLKT